MDKQKNEFTIYITVKMRVSRELLHWRIMSESCILVNQRLLSTRFVAYECKPGLVCCKLLFVLHLFASM